MALGTAIRARRFARIRGVSRPRTAPSMLSISSMWGEDLQSHAYFALAAGLFMTATAVEAAPEPSRCRAVANRSGLPIRI